MRKISLLFLILFLLPVAIAHEGEISSDGFDIDLTPFQAFQGDAVAIEAEIQENNTAVTGLSVYFVVDKHDKGYSERIEAKERTAGHYFIKHAFRYSGMNEIHVEFNRDGREIRQTFNVSVEGSSPEIEQYFQLVAILAVILAAYYAYHTKKIKKAFIVAAVLIAAVAISYSLYFVYTSGAAERGVTVCITPDECYWSAHIHAEVNIDVCGDESYRFPVEEGPLDGPHTHEEKNLIHFHERLRYDPVTKEIFDTTPLTLGAFFDNMEVNFDSGRILDKQAGDLCNGQPGSVKMYVSRDWNRNELGKPEGNFRDYIWKDGDVITIIFDEKAAPQAAPEKQSATAELTPELTLPIIVGFALIDSINPCVIGVLLLLITVLLKTKKKRAVLVNGSVYTFGVYVTYLIGGVTLLSVFNAVRDIQLLSQLFYVIIGFFVLLAAFLEIKDYFWYGRGFSLAIPKRFVGVVESSAKKSHTSLFSAFLFGSIVTLIELPCTGAPYLAIITLMSQSGVQFYSALLLLLLYNLVFVLPLIVIIYMAYKGIGYKKMEGWRREHKGKMRLAVGLMLLGISTWIITTVLEWVLLPLIVASILAVGIMYIIKTLSQHKHRHTNHKKRKT